MRPRASLYGLCLVLGFVMVGSSGEPDDLVLRPSLVANHRRGAPLDDLGQAWRSDSWAPTSRVLHGSGGGLGWRDNTVCLLHPMNDIFGSAVDLVGDSLFVAAAAEGRGAHFGGAVYVYRKQHEVWRFVQKLTGPPTSPWLGGNDPDGPGFASVVCSDDQLLVGTPCDGPYRGPWVGAVHIFEPCFPGAEGPAAPPWCHAQTLRPTTAPPPGGCNFGEFLAVDGPWLLVASHRRTARTPEGAKVKGAGAVEVFHRGDAGRWQPTGQMILSPGGPVEGVFFGGAVAMDGGSALIGEPRRPNDEGGRGRAYAYELRDGRFTHTQTLPLPDPASTAFGVAIAVDEGHAVIGTYCHPQKPMVFFYRREGGQWQLQQAVAMERGSIFGVSVAIDGELAVVGAPGEPTNGAARKAFAGAAYVFRRDRDGGWSRVATLAHPEPRPQSFFGSFYSGAIAVDGRRVVVGTHTEPWLVAHHLHLAPEGPGSAVIFEPVVNSDSK